MFQITCFTIPQHFHTSKERPGDSVQDPSQGQRRYPKELLATKILPNFRANFLVRFASKPLFYWIVPSNCSENSLVLFVLFFYVRVLFGSLPSCFLRQVVWGGGRAECGGGSLPDLRRLRAIALWFHAHPSSVWSFLWTRLYLYPLGPPPSQTLLREAWFCRALNRDYRGLHGPNFALVFSRHLGWCPSTVRLVFPTLVFQLSKQQNRTRTTSSTVLGTPPNRTRTKKFPLEELCGGCFLSWVLNWESTENWDFRRLEPYTNPYSDTS